MVYNPSVSVTVNESLSLSPGETETVVLIVGTAQWGPMDSVQIFTSFGNVLNTFKEDVDDHTSIIKAADLAYANGAQTVKVLRMEDGNADEAELALDGNVGAEAGVLTFTADYKGEYGNNFTVDVDTQGSGRTLTITNGDYVEVFDNAGAANGYTTNADIGTAINDTTNGSAILSVAVKAGSETTKLVDAIGSAQSLAGGDSGSDSVLTADYTDAIESYLMNVDWDILVIGDTDNTNLETSDAFHTAIMAKIESRATSHKKYSIYVTGIDKDETVSTAQARTTSGSRLVLCAPNIEVTSRVDGSVEILDGSYLGAAVAGMLAGNDVERGVTRKIVTVSDLSILESAGTRYYTLAHIESLLGSGILCASKIGGALKVARGVTKVSDVSSIYFEVSIRRIVDTIRTDIEALLDGFLGEPQLTRVRKMIAAECDGVLNDAVNDEVIVDYEATQVTEGSSPDTIDVAMTIQPTFSTNFINVVISVSRTSS